MENIAQIHSKLNRMPDAYLSQLVQDGSPFATVATMVLDTRQGMAQSAIEPPTSTVAEKITSQVNGLPSVAPQQNNQDPRLMEGVGGMALTERNSADTPISGIAQLPAQQMMADGGIVGYAKGGETEPAEFFGDDSDKLQWIRENPAKAAEYASYGLLAVPGAGLVGLGGRAALAGGRALLGSRLGQGVKNYFTRPGKKTLGGFSLQSGITTGPRTLRKLKTGMAASGVAGLGGLIASSDFSGGEEEPKANETLADMSGISNFDKDGFMKTLFRQGQLTGKNIATDATGQGLLGSALGGYGKATGDLAASDIAQDDKLEQLGVSASAKGVLTPANMLNIKKQIQTQKDNGDFITQAKNALATGNASEIQAELNKYGIVASGPEQLLKGLATLYEQKAVNDLVAFTAGQVTPQSTAGYSVEKVQ